MYNFTLYMTTDCNFKCQYCYEDYHNHYQLNEKTLVDSLEFMMNYGDRGKVLIDFLGGEPLLKKDLIYKAVAYIKDNYPEREVKYYITTNCSMMDDRFIAFMKENHFTVRLSFDGNKETHDLNRVAKDGVSCYEKIFENIMKVKDSGLNFSVRMTVTENTIPYMFENICYLHEHGLDNIAAKYDIDVLFNIVSSVGRAKENSEILTDMEHLDMNLKIVKYILNQGYEDKKIGGAFYQRVQVRNSCGGYGKVMAIFPEGDIYMCQCMEQNQVRMGNILSDEPQKILQELENLLKKDEIKRLFCAEYKEICKECDYRYICGGHCLASEEPYDYRCIFLKAVLNYVLFYYDSKANRRKNLEIYIEYMEEVKRRWEEEPN